MAQDESSGAKIIPKCILRPDAILSFKTFLSFINRLLEGDGTPLQYFCLENLMGGFSSPVATAEFSKFAGILSATFTASSLRNSTGISNTSISFVCSDAS